MAPSVRITIRYAPEEARRIAMMADAYGLTVAEYIRGAELRYAESLASAAEPEPDYPEDTDPTAELAAALRGARDSYEPMRPAPMPEGDESDEEPDPPQFRHATRATGPGPRRLGAPQDDDDLEDEPRSVRSLRASPFHTPNQAGIKIAQGKDYSRYRTEGHQWKATRK